MSRIEIIKKLTPIFRDVFDDGSIDITESTSAEDIEDWDSLSHIMLIGEIENIFGVKFSMEDMISMKNAGDMVSVLERLR